MATRILKNLEGAFVTSEVVREASQKEYNQTEWNRTINRYLALDSEARFFKTPGTIYEFNYYVIYVADGIRFMQEVSYGSSLTSGGFAFGFFTEGIKDLAILEQLKEIKEASIESLCKDSITILTFADGRINTTEEARKWMREETKGLSCRIFTKCF